VRALVRVVTSAESSALDSSTINAGVPSRALMQRAGAAAASEIALRFRDRLDSGVSVFAGPGNNGGDAWVIARALASAGVSVRVVEPVPAASADARAERALAVEVLGENAIVNLEQAATGGESIVVDGLLGTGSTGAPRGEIAEAVAACNAAGRRGATVVAVDLPSGMDASTGETPGELAHADLTLTFGTVKRGHLVNREACGTIVVLDIGLAGSTVDPYSRTPHLVDERWVASQLPPIPWDAHKGIRKKLAIVGGARGMAGASVLAARSAMRSGVGMVKLVVADESVPAVQEAEPQALCAAWPVDADAVARDVVSWADAVVIGPGLGHDRASAAVLTRLLESWKGPTLLDADAITIFAGRVDELATLLGARPALLTPHAVEFARLAGADVAAVLANRFEIAGEFAARLGATILLKGVPTVVTNPNGERLVSAAGTPVLATGGSGDVLSGIAGTLLAQIGDPFHAGAAAAWIHGRAAERTSAGADDAVRGLSLDDVVRELRSSWTFDTRPTRYPLLAELPLSRRSTRPPDHPSTRPPA
jgi:ADP-dependent NAD(P)H-hydrate dehydratase / NAD(P)H-hydrate epimerase